MEQQKVSKKKPKVLRAFISQHNTTKGSHYLTGKFMGFYTPASVAEYFKLKSLVSRTSLQVNLLDILRDFISANKGFEPLLTQGGHRMLLTWRLMENEHTVAGLTASKDAFVDQAVQDLTRKGISEENTAKIVAKFHELANG